LRLYPDPNSQRLKDRIAQYLDVSPKNIFIGNGSDEVLARTFCALLKHGQPVLFPDITYSFYPVYCRLYGIAHRCIPLTDDFQICIDDFIQPNGGIIFPNPNAPTGCLLAVSEIERYLRANPNSVMVVDEAYIDFGGQSTIPLVKSFPNLLIIRTLSKSRALAGLRLGFAVGDTSLIDALERVKDSFNSYPVDRLAVAGAIASYDDERYFEGRRQAVMDSRNHLIDGLNGLGFVVLPSAANFVFARHPSFAAEQLSAALRKRNIIVRHFQMPRIDQYLRITVGTEADCSTLISAMREIASETRI
jgi:histidinol-phosphate aminotransferase